MADETRGATTGADVADQRRAIGVALSGGGHRATLWGLGALLYLVDAGKGSDIACVSSVSGGSLANAWVGLRVDLRSATPAEFRRETRPVAMAAATGGTVWAAPLTFAYLGLVAAILVAAVVLSFFLRGWTSAAMWIGVILAVGWLAQQRAWVCAKAFDRTLFNDARLTDLHTAIDHVICSCDVQSAEQVYFSGRFVCSYRHGWGRPANLPLSRAVQASASLPGAFSLASLSTAPHMFVEGAQAHVKRLLLTDGGAYDNMGTEWPSNVAARNERWDAQTPRLQSPEELLVVNGSAGLGWTPRRSVRLPLLGEVTTLLAVKDVLYDQTTATRRRGLLRRFWLAELRSGVGFREPLLNGCMVQIDRSPFALPKSFANGTDEKAKRAKAALGHLSDEDPAIWSSIVFENQRVKTALSRVGSNRSTLLLRHAYALTMVNSHVVLGYPLRPLPTVAELEAWIS